MRGGPDRGGAAGGCVIKFGGSLLESPELGAWLDCLRACAERALVLVPGGGRFADAVRDSQKAIGFSDPTAHDMALLGMAQYGLVLAERLSGAFRAEHSLAALRRGLARGEALLWLPGLPLPEPAGLLTTDWASTADSIGLWLALRMRAPCYVLIKAAARPPGAMRLLQADQAPAGLVDGRFAEMQRGYTGRVYLFGGTDHREFADFIGAGR